MSIHDNYKGTGRRMGVRLPVLIITRVAEKRELT